MINSRQDYLYVDCPQPLIVDGDIMPLRALAGGQRILRAEDVLFLQEAAIERTIACSHNENVPIVGRTSTVQSVVQPIVDDHLDKYIRGERLQHIAEVFGDIKVNYCNGWPVKPTRMPYWSSESRGSSDLIPKIVGKQINATRMDANDFQSGSPLSQQALMNGFADCQTLQYPSVIMTGSDGATINGTEWTPNPSYWSTPSGGLVMDKLVEYRNGSLFDNRGANLRNGEYSIPVPQCAINGQKGAVSARHFIDELRCFADWDFFISLTNIPNEGMYEWHSFRVLTEIQGVLDGDRITFT